MSIGVAIPRIGRARIRRIPATSGTISEPYHRELKPYVDQFSSGSDRDAPTQRPYSRRLAIAGDSHSGDGTVSRYSHTDEGLTTPSATRGTRTR